MEPSGEATPAWTPVDCGIQIFSLTAARSLIDRRVSVPLQGFDSLVTRQLLGKSLKTLVFTSLPPRRPSLQLLSPGIQHHGLRTIPPQCGQQPRVLRLHNQP